MKLRTIPKLSSMNASSRRLLRGSLILALTASIFALTPLAAQTPESKNLIYTGSHNSVSYVLGQALRELLSEHVAFEVVQTDGSYDNLQRISENPSGSALVQEDVVDAAEITPRDMPYRVLLALTREPMHIVVNDRMVTSLSQLRGRSAATGDIVANCRRDFSGPPQAADVAVTRR